MDLELRNKHKRSEESKQSCKKWKVDKTSGASVLTDDDYNLIVDRMDEVSNVIFKKIDDFNTDLVWGIVDLVQDLCVAVKEVRVVVAWVLDWVAGQILSFQGSTCIGTLDDST